MSTISTHVVDTARGCSHRTRNGKRDVTRGELVVIVSSTTRVLARIEHTVEVHVFVRTTGIGNCDASGRSRTRESPIPFTGIGDPRS